MCYFGIECEKGNLFTCQFLASPLYSVWQSRAHLRGVYLIKLLIVLERMPDITCDFKLWLRLHMGLAVGGTLNINTRANAIACVCVCVHTLESSHGSVRVCAEHDAHGSNVKRTSIHVCLGLGLSLVAIIALERSGSVVGRLTRDQGVAGSSLTGGTVLCP